MGWGGGYFPLAIIIRFPHRSILFPFTLCPWITTDNDYFLFWFSFFERKKKCLRYTTLLQKLHIDSANITHHYISKLGRLNVELVHTNRVDGPTPNPRVSRWIDVVRIFSLFPWHLRDKKWMTEQEKHDQRLGMWCCLHWIFTPHWYCSARKIRPCDAIMAGSKQVSTTGSKWCTAFPQ